MNITLKCDNCQKEFERETVIHNAHIRDGRKFTYCNHECSVEGNKKNKSGWRGGEYVINNWRPTPPKEK